jgi:ATP-dependent DNA ligase
MFASSLSGATHVKPGSTIVTAVAGTRRARCKRLPAKFAVSRKRACAPKSASSSCALAHVNTLGKDPRVPRLRFRAHHRDSFSRWRLALLTRCPKTPTGMYEVTFDGYRALLLKDGDKVRIRSRNDDDLTNAYFRERGGPAIKRTYEHRVTDPRVSANVRVVHQCASTPRLS